MAQNISFNIEYIDYCFFLLHIFFCWDGTKVAYNEASIIIIFNNICVLLSTWGQHRGWRSSHELQLELNFFFTWSLSSLKDAVDKQLHKWAAESATAQPQQHSVQGLWQRAAAAGGLTVATVSFQGRGLLPVHRVKNKDSGFGLSGRVGSRTRAAGGRGLGQRGEPGGHGRPGAGQSSAHRLTCQQRDVLMEQEVMSSKKPVQTMAVSQLWVCILQSAHLKGG